jgi:triosephosphate isomerase
MHIQRRKIIAGNWKMNGTLDSLGQISQLSISIVNRTCEVVICPPATLLAKAVDITNNCQIKIGAQNCHLKNSGAFTGEISPYMLADLGVKLVILGHSERRENNFESSSEIQDKAKAAHLLNLTTIICIGETEEQKNSKQTIDVIKKQLSQSLPTTATHENTIIAYEPIWAIGSGKTPRLEDISQVHKTLRSHITNIRTSSMAMKMRIIYGGSVSEENCFEILQTKDIDGALVGGASLKAANFEAIIKKIG